MSPQEPNPRAERDPRLLRVSHADRDQMVEILRDAAADGRLETAELEERVERALTARTFADLEPLVEDLPVAAPAPPAVHLRTPRGPVSTEVAGDEGLERLRAYGQRLRREGAWRVPRVLEVDLHGGSARLDYTVARLPEGGESTLRLWAHGGSLRLTVPPHVAVDVTGVSTHGGRVRDNASRHVIPEAVTHVVTVTGSTHGGSVRVEASGTT